MNPQIVGVAIDCRTAGSLLDDLVAHANHKFVEAAPALSGASFHELASRIIGYRQVSDATLLHVARIAGMKLVTMDQAIASICPWSENLQVLPSL
jgi:hypothetical protein